MKIGEKPKPDGKMEFTVEFVEHRLEDVVSRLNRFERGDEKPFAAAAMISEFNQRAYDLFLSPLVKTIANEPLAQMEQLFHPLRMQRWIPSGINPWLRWLQPAADAIRKQRRAVGSDQTLRRLEKRGSELLSASLDYYRDIRDALSEACFFGLYGSMFSLYLGDKPQRPELGSAGSKDGKQATFVKEALAAISTGGYPEALARAGALLARRGEPLPLSRLHLKKDLLADYKEFLPDLPSDISRRIRGEQDIIVTYEREASIVALPKLLSSGEDRKRFLMLLDRLPSDSRLQAEGVTPEQKATLERIRGVLAKHPTDSTSPPTDASAKSLKPQGAQE